MDITKFSFGENTEEAVYLYNAGTYNDWLDEDAEHTPGSGPGTYTVSTPGSAGIDGVPTQVPSMQAFLVMATAEAGSVSYQYSDLLNNTDKQRVKSTKSTAKMGMKIDLLSEKYSDRMWILVDDECTNNFDNGYDGRKILGDTQVSQLYGLQEDGTYQISAVSDLNESYLGFRPGNATEFKLVFNQQETDQKYAKIYLIDLQENITTDISLDDSEYEFSANDNDIEKRFKIVALGLNITNASTNLSDYNLFSNQDMVYVNNLSGADGKLKIYNTLGTEVVNVNVESQFKTNLPKGAYIVKLEINSKNITKRIIIN